MVGQIIAGRYRVVERLGEGGVGAVYRGEHTGIGKPVAIKVLHAMFAAQPEFRKRFEREARAASKLSHPACVSVLDFGEYEGQLYLVMEYAAGRLLADRLDQGALDAVAAVLVARGIATALRHAHGLGIVHRDLKPGNVMLLEGLATGVPCKLLDFGLAKNMGPDPGDALTQMGMVFGTPGYISPEQAQGLPADARSDLYSLGVMLWEMLVGRKPFVHDDPVDTLRDHIHTPAPRPRTFAPRVSPALDALVGRLLEKDPRARFQSAEELLGALAGLPEGSTRARVAAEPAAPAAPPPPRRAAAIAAPPPASDDTEKAPPIVIARDEPTPASRKSPAGAPDLAQLASGPRVSRLLVALGTVGAVALLILAGLAWRLQRPAGRESVRAAAGRPSAPPLRPERTERPERSERADRADRPPPSGGPSVWGRPAPEPPPAREPPPEDRPPDRVPPEASRHAARGHELMSRLWCRDGFGEYERAIFLHPDLRADPRISQDAIHCLIESQHARSMAIRFLGDVVGQPAEGRLRRLAGDSRSPEVRRAAEAALSRIHE